ncbi:MAG: 50S ribosomal protein L6, partial [Candidatus Paceibacterota bacterium]
YIKIEIKDNQIFFTPQNTSKQARANWGTVRSLVQNAVLGVSEGFTKVLEIEGVGYRAETQGNDLVLNVDLSHPIKISPPEGIKISTEKNTIKVFGIDKALVGGIAAKIRSVKKPEPYKGKGIRYQGEVIRRKAGKKVAGTTT